ncbi:nuclear transport factor 2 family protein [Arenimonas sp.]|uniref:nuclear transport factor 2 family protein n=1 Tax=Arenimonas sp. TaxID=1872635 RepID=UPI0039E4042A
MNVALSAHASLLSGADADIALLHALDDEYQSAVKNNDAETMDRILTDNFTLVTGRGAIIDKQELLREAWDEKYRYERQESSERTVRLLNADTAVVSALLWVKAEDREGGILEYKVLFSDVYIRTATGWRYAFAQSSTRKEDAG